MLFVARHWASCRLYILASRSLPFCYNYIELIHPLSLVKWFLSEIDEKYHHLYNMILAFVSEPLGAKSHFPFWVFV